MKKTKFFTRMTIEFDSFLKISDGINNISLTNREAKALYRFLKDIFEYEPLLKDLTPKQRKAMKKMIKRYGSSIQLIKPKKGKVKPLSEICGKIKAPKGFDIDRLMARIRGR